MARTVLSVTRYGSIHLTKPSKRIETNLLTSVTCCIFAPHHFASTSCSFCFKRVALDRRSYCQASFSSRPHALQAEPEQNPLLIRRTREQLPQPATAPLTLFALVKLRPRADDCTGRLLNIAVLAIRPSIEHQSIEHQSNEHINPAILQSFNPSI